MDLKKLYYIIYYIMSDKFANAWSTLTLPNLVNNNEFIPVTNIDSSKSWKICGDYLKCCSPGSWQFLAQYQLYNLNSVDTGKNATLEGWFNINDKNIENYASTSYALKKDGSNVMVNCLAYKFKKGDKIRFGVRSTSIQDPPVLNIVAKGFITASGVYAASLGLTITRIM
jgi:hypothetical protein